MEESMEERLLELKAEVLKVLAQPTRLKILELLRNGERCICEIVPAINGEQSNISEHISLMQKSQSYHHPKGWSEGDGQCERSQGV